HRCLHSFPTRRSSDLQVDALQRADKPVLWLDMGDNVGGGALGDSVVLLKALEEDGRLRCFSCIFDPSAVAALWKHGCGDTVVITDRKSTRLNSSHVKI